MPPTDPWYEDLTDIAPYDPEAAKAALADGRLRGRASTSRSSWPNIYPTTDAEFVASQLAEVGINVEIQPVEFSVWLEQVYTNHDYDMTAVLHVEPHDIGNYANPDYYWQYDSPKVQQLIDDAKVNPDPDEAVELLKQAARQISEDSPVDWLILGRRPDGRRRRTSPATPSTTPPRGSTPPGSSSPADPDRDPQSAVDDQQPRIARNEHR